jgi:hypothetical protein
MSNFTLADVSGVIASYGRGVVFYSEKWDTISPLAMTQLGVTEGDITVNTNGATAGLTLPELTGPIPHEMDYLGENPVIEIPLYLADPALIAIVSPSGSAHAGRSRRGPVKEYTLAIFPEALFLQSGADGIVTDHSVAFDGAGVWKFNNAVLTEEQQRLLDASFWLWRVVFNRPTRRFRGGAGDDKKNIETVSTQSMHHPDLPEGHHIYTSGDPFESNIDLNGSAS